MKLTTIVILAHLLSTTALAQQAAQAPDKKVTLGDLIKKVKDESRQLQLNKTQKNSVVVPDTKALFEEKKDTNLAAVKPPKLSEIYETDKKSKIEYEKTLNQQIGELYKMTQKFKASQKRGKLWLRFSELYGEKKADQNFGIPSPVKRRSNLLWTYLKRAISIKKRFSFMSGSCVISRKTPKFRRPCSSWVITTLN